MPDEEIERTKNHLFNYGANVKRVYNTAAYNNLDIYQVNCTYYSARISGLPALTSCIKATKCKSVDWIGSPRLSAGLIFIIRLLQ